MPLPLLLLFILPGAAAQADLSLTFQDLGPVLTGPALGLPAGQGVVQPTAAVLPDGRVRLYYSTLPPGPPTGGPVGIYSAISTDGVHFTPEPGQRFSSPNSAQIEQLPDGRWRLYYVQHDLATNAATGIASAIGADGLSFAPEPGLRLANPIPGAKILTCCGIVQLPDGRYRMYVGAQEFGGLGSPPLKIYSAVSSDLVAWTLEPGIRLTMGFASGPAALLSPDSSFMLVFGSCIPCGIKIATSADGLSFGAPKSTEVTASVGDPAFVTLPGGRLLMYYDRSPDTGASEIDAAVATRIGPPLVSYPTHAVTAITPTSARVSATLDPQGADTDYLFQYGTSSGYGDTTDQRTIAATGGRQSVSETLTGLVPAKTYHFRLEASSAAGVTDGTDQTFTTVRAACRLKPQRDGHWEIALARAKSRTLARKALRRARRLVPSKTLVERDGCTDYEPAIVRLQSKASALVALRRAKALGYRRATLEPT
jgi:hypothetical protein